MSRNLGPMFALLIMGAGWGITSPLSKIAVSTGHQPLGLVFWQMLIGAVLLGTIVFVRGGRLALGRRQITLYLAIAFLGTILPNAAQLSRGSSFACWGYVDCDRDGAYVCLSNCAGVGTGPVQHSTGCRAGSWPWRCGAPCGARGEPAGPRDGRIYTAGFGLRRFSTGLRAILSENLVRRALIQLRFCLAHLFSVAVLSFPLALGFGHWLNPLGGFGAPESALVLSSIVHALVYAGYVWLVGRAGAVFAAQVSYLVTIFGVGWAMLILDEAYSGYIWGALGLMLLGMFLVQPRDREELAA